MSRQPALHILVVDDDEDDIFLIKELIKEGMGSGGASVMHAASCTEALSLLGGRSYDVCLFDYHLGECDGIELIGKCRASGVTSPVIFLTGQGDEEIAVSAMKAGAVDYLAKSKLTSELLCHAIRLAIELGKKEEQNRQATGALEASESRYRQLVTLLPAVVCEIAPDGKVVFFNPALTAITGYLPEELEGFRLWEVLQPLGAHEISADLQNRFISKDVVNFEAAIFARSGEMKVLNWNAIRRVGDDGVLQSVICIGVDTTELVNLRNRLREASLLDELTGLKNRRGFITVAQQQMKIAQRSGKDMVLVFIDLDGMKQINDRQGHQAGDIALTQTADILRSTFRDADILARIGGDEFVALLVGLQGIDDGMILKRLQEEVARNNARQDAGTAPLSLSAGIARYTAESSCTLDELIKSADAAMYECKQRKRELAS